MSKNYLINGEIFLRKNPTKVDLKELKQNIEEFKYAIDEEENNDYKSELIERLYELTNDYNYYIENAGLDYGSIIDFYFLITNGYNYQLTNSSDPSNYIEYNDIRLLENDFISLIDFLKEAEFIGRKFYRTKSIISPSINEAIQYMDDRENNELGYCEFIALYKTKDLLLVQRIYKDKEIYLTNYEIIDKRYLQDNNIKYYGEVYNIFKDKFNLYIDILKEITNYKKPKGYSQ